MSKSPYTLVRGYPIEAAGVRCRLAWYSVVGLTCEAAGACPSLVGFRVWPERPADIDFCKMFNFSIPPPIDNAPDPAILDSGRNEAANGRKDDHAPLNRPDTLTEKRRFQNVHYSNQASPDHTYHFRSFHDGRGFASQSRTGFHPCGKLR